MADKNTIVVLNIGAQRVGMARFKTKQGSLMLTDYASSEILADPAAANTRNAQIKISVLELAKKLNVKNRVSYAVSGQSVFMRFVLLPELDGVSKLELVTAEAQQNIPFALNDVKWDWQEVAEVNGESEVVIAAIKSKVLNDIQDAVEGAGMFTTEVDPAPTALYNAFRLNYPDVTEPVMLLDVGAKTSTVIYVDGKRLFSRSIAIGGATVTSAIAKEYNVPFTEAEAQKKSNGVVALDTRHTSKMDELTAALATCIRTALNRMPAEISRTTNFYRSQQNGGAPQKVYLAGGGANLPKITSFLQEKLRLPVEHFNPLRKVAVDKAMDLDELSKEAHMLGELVGLAARRVGKTQVKLDLVPDSVQKEKDLDKRKSKLFIGAGAAVLGLFVWWVLGWFTGNKFEKARDQLANDLSVAKPIAADMNKLVKTQTDALPDVNSLAKMQEERVRWVNILNELKSEYCGKKYWFTEVQPVVNFTPKTNFSDMKFRISEDKLNQGGSSPLYDEGSNPSQNLVNAIMIKGTWLDKNHQITESTNTFLGRELTDAEVKKIVSGQQLPEENAPVVKSSKFSRVLKYSEGKGSMKSVSLGGDRMFKIKPRWDESKIGSEFILVLPLKEPFGAKKSKKK